MKRELREQFARLGPIQAIARVASGSPEDLVLRPADGLRGVNVIPAVETLAKRGMTLLKAKRAVDAMVETGEAVVHVPTVEDAKAFTAELRAAGIAVRRVASAPVDAKAIRTALGLTQEQFARRYSLDIDALQNWEQGRCQPDRPALALLRAIAAAPLEVAIAQEERLV